MKRIGSLLLVSIFAGAITLGSYKLFFEKTNYKIVSSDSKASMFTTSYSPTSPAGAGINDVDFTEAAQKTVDAVVHIKNLSVVSSGPRNIMEFIYGFQGEERPQVGIGSGVIITPDGYIVTNNHVIQNNSKLEVSLNNNKTYEATLIGTDPNSDIALIKIDPEEHLPYLAFGDSDNTKVGQWVLAVGNPFDLTSTVTAGIISAKARNLGKNQSFLQTDAAVNPGNSGGALVNTNGDLIGINTAITSQTGSYVGYSFAVPSNIAKKVVDDILEYGNVQKGILGINGVRMDSPYAIENGINEVDGVYIDGVEEGSGAYDAKLQHGDIIKKVDNIDVHRFADLTDYIATKSPGDLVNVTIDRDEELLVVPVTLKERQTLVLPTMGIEVQNLTKDDMKQFRTKAGVKIIGVPETYRGYGLKGKVLIAVNNKEIKDKQDAKNLFGAISKYERTSITMINEKGERERLIFQ